MKKLLTVLLTTAILPFFHFSALHAQHDIWIDINGVRDLTADSIDSKQHTEAKILACKMFPQ